MPSVESRKVLKAPRRGLHRTSINSASTSVLVANPDWGRMGFTLTLRR